MELIFQKTRRYNKMKQKTVLGKNIQYRDIEYSPDVLVRQLRAPNREKYNIYNNNLPFSGYDE